MSAIPQDPTLQEVFDHVARHLLKQGKRCTFSEGGNGCAMAAGSMRCAVGSLLGRRQVAEARSRRELNNSSIRQSAARALVADSLGLESLDSEAVDLLSKAIHDLDYPDAWRNSLLALAGEWGFDTSALDTKAVQS